jgi:Ca2+-transporting ATPase
MPQNEQLDAFLEQHHSAPHGLTASEAKKRLIQNGANLLLTKKRRPLIFEFLDEFKDLMVIILMVAAIIAFFSGETTDSIIILIVVILNAAIGFIQKYRAEKAIEALRKIITPHAKVLRDGKPLKIPAAEVVVGDILLLEEGDTVNADALLFFENELQTQEAILTGESSPVEKISLLEEENPLQEPDKIHMVFMGTMITHGHGRAVVTHTGMKTEMGHIAKLTTETKKDKSPLQKELANIGIFAGQITFVITGILFLFGVLIQKKPIIDTLIFATSVAVAAVPEGLPATITIALAIGVQKLAKKKAIIKQLSSIETLGATTVICSDKTGTLTKNEMTVKELYFDRYAASIRGVGYDPQGSIHIEHTDENCITIGKVDDPYLDYENNRQDLEKMADNHPEMFSALELILLCAGLCNNSDLIREQEPAPGARNVVAQTQNGGAQTGGASETPAVNTGKISWKSIGDPTEAALITLVKKSGFNLEAAKEKFQKIHEYPFDSTRKRMTILVKDRDTGKIFAFSKGAPGSILGSSTHVILNNHPVLIDAETYEDYLNKNETMARNALRCLGFAYRELTPLELRKLNKEKGKMQLSHLEAEQNLVFLGIMGMIDPARPEVQKAIELTQRAGIKVYIITGDSGLTAEAVAKEIGLIQKDNHRIIFGEQLEKMTMSELKKILAQKGGEIIFARVSPADKLKIVSALKENGEVVAVTGDGVNDAPALKRSDIGIAMGTGTDVSKEAANMILSDDSFATIVMAIQEGRNIYDNLKKSIFYVFSSNIGELILIFGAIVLNLPMPLTAILILFVNLTTDVLPAIALGVEPAEPDIMDQAPRQPKQKILNRRFILHLFYIGIVMGTSTLLAYMWDLSRLHVTFDQIGQNNANYLKASTLAFIIMVTLELAHSISSKSSTVSVFKMKLFNNPVLLWSIAASFGLAVAIFEIPGVNGYFHTMMLDGAEWTAVLVCTIIIILAAEIRKFIKRRESPQVKTSIPANAH